MEQPKRTAALAYGYVSQNIGNAFFQVGGRALLERTLGAASVSLIQDVPAHWTMHRKSRGNPANWWPATAKAEADYVVFQGPSLDAHSIEALDGVFGALVARGVEPVLLSTGFMTYSDDEIESARKLIDRHRIRVVFTRDARTFGALGGRASYCGIDSAFFLPWAVEPTRLVADPYIALSFERLMEPRPRISGVLDGEGWSEGLEVRGHRLANRVTTRSQAASYAVHRLRRGIRQQEINGRQVVRVLHRSNPADVGRFFKDANTMVSDEPYTYVSVYAQADLVVTDRVHACVLAAAYGVPALMVLDTPRNALLERVGFRFPMEHPFLIDQEMLERERLSEQEALRNALTGG